jgi:hypothetical protein
MCVHSRGSEQRLGDAFALDIIGQHTIVLGSAEAAFELLDARGAYPAPPRAATRSPTPRAGAIYSDRPTAVMAGELSFPFFPLLPPC